VCGVLNLLFGSCRAGLIYKAGPGGILFKKALGMCIYFITVATHGHISYKSVSVVRSVSSFARLVVWYVFRYGMPCDW
jgi:hypothetical protein